MNTLNSVIGTHAQERPDAPALIYRGQTITYLEFKQRSCMVAANLARLGIGEGDRVAIWLPEIPAWLEVFFACSELGAIAVAVNTRFRSSEVGDVLERSGAKVLILCPNFKGINFIEVLSQIDARCLTKIESVVAYNEGDELYSESIGKLPVCSYETLLRSAEPVPNRASADSGCIIFATSGTTKRPKLVLHAQKGVAHHAREVAIGLGFDQPKAVLLQVIPFCGVYGFSQAVAALAGGAGIVCVPEFNADDTLTLIDTYRITHLCGSDEMFARLMDVLPNSNPFPNVAFCGFATFTPSLGNIVELADQRGLKLVGLYGASEILAFFASQNPDDTINHRARMGGFPVSAGATVRVRDLENGRLLGTDETGELEFKCPSLMHQYFNNKNATTAAFTSDGFFKSGDLGCLRQDGSFEFLSRMGDVLRLGGFLVNPQEIETYIQTHSEVDGCQLVGVDGPRGIRPVGFVIMQNNATALERDLIDHCKAGMAKYKVPFRIFLVDEFPTTTGPNGTKIQRARLREMAIEKINITDDT